MPIFVDDWFGSCFFYALMGGIISIACWFVWKSWVEGSRESSRQLRLDRLEENLCPSCGYDMRASEGRCPECGEEPTIPDPEDKEDHNKLDMAKLNSDWPTASIKPIIPSFFEDPVLIHSTMSATEADLLAEQLQARGVYATVGHRQQEEVVGSLAVTAHYYRVVVPTAEEERALVILDRFRRTPSSLAKQRDPSTNPENTDDS